MFAKNALLLTVTPGEVKQAQGFGVPLAHLTYRVGGGPHLFRSSQPVAPRGGYMVIDDAGFTPGGEVEPFCHEVLRECAARGFEGVICAFTRRMLPTLGEIVAQLGELMHRRGLPLFVTEPYARCCPHTRVLISSALSGGSLQLRLSEAREQYGPGRAALAVERVCRDFFLPSPTGQGAPLTQEELHRRMEERSPSVFFSHELCAHYFTYMSPGSGAHFILFDDAASIRKKLQLAQSLDIDRAVLSYRQTADLLGELLG